MKIGMTYPFGSINNNHENLVEAGFSRPVS